MSFVFDVNTGKMISKNTNFIYIDTLLPLPLYIGLLYPESNNIIYNMNKEKYIYDLFAICNHSGSVYGGHYSAVIKNSNGKWYNFNDTEVKEVNITTNIISGNVPYCLFYRKKKVVS